MANIPRFPGLVPRPSNSGGLVARATAPPNQTFSRPPATTINRVSAPREPGRATIGGANSLLPLVYGECYVQSGKIFAYVNNPRYTTFGIAWCHGEVEQVVNVYMNDKLPPALVTVANYVGSDVQNYDGWLNSEIYGYLDDLPGICYSVISIRNDADVSDFPSFSAHIKGKLISSYQGGPKEYANGQNPALILCDIIESDVYGLNANVDWTSATDAANACNELIGGVPKYQLSMVIDQAVTGADLLQNIRDYARLFVIPEGNYYRILMDVTGSSVKTYNKDNIVEGSLRVSNPGFSRSPTMVEVTYTDTTAFPYAQATYATTPVVPRLLSRLSRPGITRKAEAIRYAEDRLADLALQMNVSWQTFDDALAIQAGDIVTLTHDIGFTNRLLRVVSIDPIDHNIWKIDAIQINGSLSTDTTVDPTTERIVPPVAKPLALVTYSYNTNITNTYTATGYDVVPAAYFNIIVAFDCPEPAAGESIVVELTGAPPVVTLGGAFDYLSTGYNNADNVAIDISEYDATQVGITFYVQARTTDNAYISPILVVTITNNHYPVNYWWQDSIQYFNGTFPYVTTNEYPQYWVAGDHHQIYRFGYQWLGTTTDVTWVITQLTGTTRNIYIAHYYGMTWRVTRDESTDYAGTSYEFQMQIDAVDFGDPFTLTCEV